MDASKRSWENEKGGKPTEVNGSIP